MIRFRFTHFLAALMILTACRCAKADDEITINNPFNNDWYVRVVPTGRTTGGYINAIVLAVQKTLKVYDVFKIPKKSSQVFRFGSGAGPYFVRFQLVDASDNWVELSAERKDAKDKTALPTYTYLFNTIHDGTTRTVAGLIKAAGNRIDIMAESLGGDPVPRADAAGAERDLPSCP